jgi:uncharacterized protein YndB with AHSA1/START domain
VRNPITISTTINAPIAEVWKFWNLPEHITRWAFASDDWEAPSAENDLQIGGRFKTRMQSKDGKDGFDFEGVYDAVVENKLIVYTLTDGRQVTITFDEGEEGVKITETFEPESENSEELQRSGWQAILDNFKRYVERSLPS